MTTFQGGFGFQNLALPMTKLNPTELIKHPLLQVSEANQPHSPRSRNDSPHPFLLTMVLTSLCLHGPTLLSFDNDLGLGALG